MVDLGKKISWKVESATHEQPMAKIVADHFLFFVKSCEGKVSISRLLKECELFDEQRNHIKSEYTKFIEKISEESFLASFIVWVKDLGPRDVEMLELAQILLDNGLIGIADDEGQLWTIRKAKSFDHTSIIEAIRSHREWPLTSRENLVRAYLSFISWLSAQTCSYISRLEDPNVVRSRGRTLPYSSFISFLEALPNEKAQLVSSLLYFGGTRTLEEVLQLSLKSVDFEKNVIHYEAGPVSYPAHVFENIKAVAQHRSSGKLFFGRQGTSLNPATIFRNFKEAALKCGLGPIFTPSCLTSSQ